MRRSRQGEERGGDSKDRHYNKPERPCEGCWSEAFRPRVDATRPEVIRLVVMMYIRYPLSLRQVEDILFERGIDICHEALSR